MTKTRILELIQRRYRISQRAALIEARDRKNGPMVNYHSGCMGVLACLEGDIIADGRKRKRSRASTPEQPT